MTTENTPQQAQKQGAGDDQTKKITLQFSIPNVKIEAPGLKFSLKNTFNTKALVLGGLTALSVILGFELVWSLKVALSSGAYATSALSHIGLFTAGAAVGLWNAHAVGGKTVLFNNVAANAARNVAFMGTNFMGASMIAAFPALIAVGGGGAVGVALTLAGAVGVAAAVWGAKNLKWTPEKPQTENPAQTPRLKGPIRLSKQQPDATPAP